MNEKEIVKILKPHIRQFQIDKSLDVCRATTNIQNADSQTVVFYRIMANDNSHTAFYERWGEKEIGCLITNELPKKYVGNYILINEDNFLEAQKKVSNYFYPLRESLKLIGVTGTNGKTSTVEFIRQLGTQINKSVMTLGTLGLVAPDGSVTQDLAATTPSYLDLRRILFDCTDGIDLVALEVSSHALAQKRLYDLNLDAAIWTSFSQDHLDYHKSIDEYFAAKLKITNYLKRDSGCLFITQREKELFRRLEKTLTPKVLRVVDTWNSQKYQVSPLTFKADYNRSNIELAAASLSYLFLNDENYDYEIQNILAPEGRFFVQEHAGRFFIIDYAHTPAALDSICEAIKKSWPEKKLLTVFGCGGNRDRTKRPLMLAAAQRHSDALFITSDNPRDEDAMDIIKDILAPTEIENTKHFVDPSREAAILKALSDEKFEIILIAGKGHENFQEIKGKKYLFSDYATVKKWMENE